MNLIAKPVQFIQEVRQELGKVAWSTRQEILAATGVVFVSTGIIAGFIGILDFVLSQLLRMLFR